MRNLVGRIGGVAGEECKHNKLVPPETKIWLPGGHKKIVNR